MYVNKKDDYNVVLSKELHSLYEKKTEYGLILGDLTEKYVKCELEIVNSYDKIDNKRPLDKDVVEALIRYFQDSLEEIDKKIKEFKLSKSEVTSIRKVDMK